MLPLLLAESVQLLLDGGLFGRDSFELSEVNFWKVIPIFLRHSLFGCQRLLLFAELSNLCGKREKVF